MSGPLDPNPTSGIDSGLLLLFFILLLGALVLGLMAYGQMHEPYYANYLDSGGV